MKFKSDEPYLCALGCLFLGLAVIIWALSLPGCANPAPDVDVSFWAGDSAKEGISRSQENRTIQCKDPAFDQYVCLNYDDLQKTLDAVTSCEKWPESPPDVSTDSTSHFHAYQNRSWTSHTAMRPIRQNRQNNRGGSHHGRHR